MNHFDENLSTEKGQLIFVATSQEKIIGCCMVKILDETRVKLRQMAVHPDFQGLGIGKRIVRRVENWC